MMIAPFLPLEFKMKGVSQDMIGIIFGTFAAARLISPFFLGLLIDKVN
jgi:MFS family permease